MTFFTQAFPQVNSYHQNQVAYFLLNISFFQQCLHDFFMIFFLFFLAFRIRFFFVFSCFSRNSGTYRKKTNIEKRQQEKIKKPQAKTKGQNHRSTSFVPKFILQPLLLRFFFLIVYNCSPQNIMITLKICFKISYNMNHTVLEIKSKI